MARSARKCSNCEQSGKLHYWSLDDEQAAIKAESCDDCGTYLKILYQEKEPKVEAVADDLASLVLDARMSKKATPVVPLTRSCFRVKESNL